MSLQIAHNLIGSKRRYITSYRTVLVRACRICARIVRVSSYNKRVRSQESARIMCHYVGRTLEKLSFTYSREI